MSSERKYEYLLPRTSIEASRLDDQHRTLVNTVGYFAHPSLGDLSQFRFILDNGTGTSIWLNSALAGGTDGIATNLKEDAVVEGADISDNQFPPLEKRHAKLGELYVHDVTQPFPSHKLARYARCFLQPSKLTRSRYDLIHQRLLITALTLDQWPYALRNLLQVLRTSMSIKLCMSATHFSIEPGGFLSALDLNLGWHREGVEDGHLPSCLQLANHVVKHTHTITRKLAT